MLVALFFWKETNAAAAIRYVHHRTEYGRRPRTLARHRDERLRFRQADHRRRQLLHGFRPRPRPSEKHGFARVRSHRRGRRRGARVQHHRRRRRHRHGPFGHVVLASLPRGHRRLGRVHGQCSHGGRACVHIELRQDHAGDAHGGPSSQHPRHFRFRRAHGIGGAGRRRHRAPHRFNRRHRTVRRRRAERRSARTRRGKRVSYVRLVLGHVYGQFHELPDRGPRTLAPWKRLNPCNGAPPPRPVRGGRAAHRRSVQAILRAGR